MTPAQRLVQRLPGDLWAVYATSGQDTLRPAFGESQLGKIWHEPSVQTFYGQLKTAVLAKIRESLTEPDHRETFEASLDIIKLAARRPLAAGIGETSAGQEGVYGFVVIDTADLKPQMTKAIDRLEATQKDKIRDMEIGGIRARGLETPNGTAVYWGWVKDLLVIGIDDSEGKALRTLMKEPAPTSQPVYLSAVSNLPNHGDLKIFYLDTQRVGHWLSAQAAAKSEGLSPTLGQLAERLGVSKVQSLAVRAGFEGSEIIGDCLLAVPDPRNGLFAQIRPVDLGIFNQVPAKVTGAAAWNVDVAGVYDLVMGTVKAMKPKEYEDLEESIREVEEKAGINLRKEILGRLAGPAVAYAVPGAGGPGMGMMMGLGTGGKVLVASVREGKGLEKALSSLEAYLAEESEGKFQATSQDLDGRTYHFWTVPQLAMLGLSPCWTVSGDTWVLASNMNLCRSAVNQVTTRDAKASSIRGVKAFEQATAKLPEKTVFVEFVDHRQQGREMMQMLQSIWPVAVMMLQQKGKISLPMALPPSEDVVRHLGPEIGYAWFDAEGLRCLGRGPGIDTSGEKLIAIPFMVGVAMPAITRAREQARRMQAMSNLRQIGLAAYAYAEKHNGKLPESLEALAAEKAIDPKFLASPRKPKTFQEPSYLFVTGQTTKSPSENILAYENPAFSGEGLNVLFVDGHVEWMKPAQFKKALSETCNRLSRPVPDVQFPPAQKEKSPLDILTPEAPSTQPGM